MLQAMLVSTFPFLFLCTDSFLWFFLFFAPASGGGGLGPLCKLLVIAVVLLPIVYNPRRINKPAVLQCLQYACSMLRASDKCCQLFAGVTGHIAIGLILGGIGPEPRWYPKGVRIACRPQSGAKTGGFTVSVKARLDSYV